jgi:hypothetical protein
LEISVALNWKNALCFACKQAGLLERPKVQQYADIQEFRLGPFLARAYQSFSASKAFKSESRSHPGRKAGKTLRSNVPAKRIGHSKGKNFIPANLSGG